MIELNQELFGQYMTGGEKPVLVEYWAPWCVYCRRLAPALDRLAQSREDIVVAKLNIDEVPMIAHQEQIEVIPTLVLYEKGHTLGSIVAPESRAAIEDFLLDTLGE